MNKIAKILGLALCTGLVACSEFDLPNPPGQSNPEVPVFNVADFAIEQGAQNIDLPACVELSENVVIAKITNASNLAEPYTYAFEVEVADNSDFTGAVTTAATVEGDDIVLLPSDLNSIIYNNFTKDPAAINVWTRINAYAVYGTTKVRLGDADSYFGNGYEFHVLPFKPARPIESSYYLLTRTPGATAWNVTAGLPFTHTSDGSPYDNPVFMVKFDVPAGGLEWAVLPGSNFDAANTDVVYGVHDAEELSGFLAESNGADAVAGLIADESPYSVTVNMETLTYKVAFAYESLYVLTNNSTDFTKAHWLTTTNFLNYSGVVRLVNEWFLAGQANMDGTLFMAGEETVVDEENGNVRGDIIMTDKSNSDAVKMTAAPGLYYLDVNLGLLSYRATRINTIGLVGQFNGWDQENSVALTPSSTSLVWNLKDIELPEGPLKFCCNNSWDVNFGALEADPGEDTFTALTGDLRIDGKNINIAEAGKYDVKVNFSNEVPVFTFTKK